METQNSDKNIFKNKFEELHCRNGRLYSVARILCQQNVQRCFQLNNASVVKHSCGLCVIRQEIVLLCTNIISITMQSSCDSCQVILLETAKMSLELLSQQIERVAKILSILLLCISCEIEL